MMRIGSGEVQTASGVLPIYGVPCGSHRALDVVLLFNYNNLYGVATQLSEWGLSGVWALRKCIISEGSKSIAFLPRFSYCFAEPHTWRILAYKSVESLFISGGGL